MKKNYEAWQIKIDDFKEQTTAQEKNKFLVRFGILAPSSHNAQPWCFSVDEEGIDVLLDMDRTLLIGDSNNRQSCVSIGCAIANIITAADYYGCEAEISYKKIAPVGAPVARIILKNGNKNISDNAEHLIFSIIKRTTNRRAYKDIILPQEFLNTIKSFQSENEKIFAITDKETRSRAAGFSGRVLCGKRR